MCGRGGPASPKSDTGYGDAGYLLLIRISLTLLACWVITVAFLFGFYFALRAAFTLWK